MAKKKLILFIVEGATEEFSLDTVLSSLLKSYLIRFDSVDGDILTKFLYKESVKKSIGDTVKSYLERYGFQKENVYKVVHLIDTDGCFVPDSCIVQDSLYTIDRGCFYTETEIRTDNPNLKKERNKNKCSSINAMTTLQKSVVMGNIPYEIYYFSCNREHALQNEINISKERKNYLALQFRKTYKDYLDNFLTLLNEISPDTTMSYEDSWQYLKTGFHSLERSSNFNIFFKDVNLIKI